MFQTAQLSFSVMVYYFDFTIADLTKHNKKMILCIKGLIVFLR